MGLFKKKDRNKLDGHFISDILINTTNNLIGKNRDDVQYFFGDGVFHEKRIDNGNFSLVSELNNNCILGISFENDTVFKIAIWLNHKLNREDYDNLALFGGTHEDKYFTTYKPDDRMGRFVIAFESKLY